MTAKIIINIGEVDDEDGDEVSKAVEAVEATGYGYDLCFYDENGKEIEA